MGAGLCWAGHCGQHLAILSRMKAVTLGHIAAVGLGDEQYLSPAASNPLQLPGTVFSLCAAPAPGPAFMRGPTCMEASQFLPALGPFWLLSSPAPLCPLMPTAVPLTHLSGTLAHQGCAMELLAPTFCLYYLHRLLKALCSPRKLECYLKAVELSNCPSPTDDIKHLLWAYLGQKMAPGRVQMLSQCWRCASPGLVAQFLVQWPVASEASPWGTNQLWGRQSQP